MTSSAPPIVDGRARPSREQLLADFVRERDDWRALIAEAGDRVNEPGAAGTWTLRDVVAHINAYHRFLLQSLGGTVREIAAMPPEIGFDVEKRNQWMHDCDRDLPWDVVAAEAQELHEALLARIGGLTDEQLDEPMVDWQAWPRWRWIIGLTGGHYEEHLPALREWLGHRH